MSRTIPCLSTLFYGFGHEAIGAQMDLSTGLTKKHGVKGTYVHCCAWTHLENRFSIVAFLLMALEPISPWDFFYPFHRLYFHAARENTVKNDYVSRLFFVRIHTTVSCIGCPTGPFLLFPIPYDMQFHASEVTHPAALSWSLAFFRKHV